jgi:hypothetical protein
MNTTGWSREELIAYVLLYAAHSDFKENNLERNIIISKVDMPTFQAICNEFEKDNDYQSITKILSGFKEHNYSKEDMDLVMTDIQTLFFSDGKFNIYERNIFRSLKRLFNSI